MKKLLISALALFVVGSVAAQEGLGETYNKAVAANSKDFIRSYGFRNAYRSGGSIPRISMSRVGLQRPEECAGVLFPNGSYGC